MGPLITERAADHVVGSIGRKIAGQKPRPFFHEAVFMNEIFIIFSEAGIAKRLPVVVTLLLKDAPIFASMEKAALHPVRFHPIRGSGGKFAVTMVILLPKDF